jgi:hypothetical protein
LKPCTIKKGNGLKREKRPFLAVLWKGKQKVKDVSLTYKNLFLHYKQAYTRIPLAVGLQVRVGMRGPHLLFFALPYLREEAKGL